GHECLILSGVTLGDGVVVGAGSVVRQNVPPYAIVAGNPARVAGFRFPPEQIKALLRIKCWDWSVEQITEAIDLLMADDIQAFIDAYDVRACVMLGRCDMRAPRQWPGRSRHRVSWCV